MNYFAHACEFLEDPYFVAGTALPDWLNVVGRRIRVRRREALRWATDSRPHVAALAAGALQHLEDDAWFHTTPAFGQLSLELTAACRGELPGDEGFRPSFLGHILVELLLDAELIAADPERLSAYYSALESLDARALEEALACLTGGRAQALVVPFVPRFVEERFLWDYLDDAKLWFRLNQVMQRVGLPALPERFCRFLPKARQQVAARSVDLLTPHGERMAG